MEIEYKPLDALELKKAHVFIAGDIILDSYIQGQVLRISPEAPVPVLVQQKSSDVLGGAANVAANIVVFGGKAILCGRIGADADGVTLQRLLDKFQIEASSLVVSKTLPTIRKMRVLSGSAHTAGVQQIVRIDNEVVAPLSEQEEVFVVDQFEKFAKSEFIHKSLVISDYDKGFLSENLVKSLISIAKTFSIPIVTDPKSTDVQRYAGSSLIKPNLSEGKALYRVNHPQDNSVSKSFEEQILDIGNSYLQKSQAMNLVMSLSEHGVLAMGLDFPKPVHLRSKALQVADVSGAGDTLVAFIAMALGARLSLVRSVELANMAAGLVCGKKGTATLSSFEFLNAYKHESESLMPQKLLALKDLKELVSDLRAQHQKVVFTNGCFDILHAGHVTYLHKARRAGDVLVVALNSDASVKRLKGPTRPVQSQEDRALVLSSLSCVDFVVIFEEDTPLETICDLKPDVLVKGADYNLETTVGAKEVLSWGGEVSWIELVPGRSTTRILNS